MAGGGVKKRPSWALLVSFRCPCAEGAAVRYPCHHPAVTRSEFGLSAVNRCSQRGYGRVMTGPRRGYGGEMAPCSPLTPPPSRQLPRLCRQLLANPRQVPSVSAPTPSQPLANSLSLHANSRSTPSVSPPTPGHWSRPTSGGSCGEVDGSWQGVGGSKAGVGRGLRGVGGKSAGRRWGLAKSWRELARVGGELAPYREDYGTIQEGIFSAVCTVFRSRCSCSPT